MYTSDLSPHLQELGSYRYMLLLSLYPFVIYTFESFVPLFMNPTRAYGLEKVNKTDSS